MSDPASDECRVSVRARVETATPLSLSLVSLVSLTLSFSSVSVSRLKHVPHNDASSKHVRHWLSRPGPLTEALYENAVLPLYCLCTHSIDTNIHPRSDSPHTRRGAG